MNNVVLVGRLTKDVELKEFGNDKVLAQFVLAVNKRFKRDEANFINVVAWNQLAKLLAQYTSKGSQIGIIGELQTRSYENEVGKRVYVTEVAAEQIQFLSKANSGEQQQSSTEAQSKPSQKPSDPFKDDGRPINIEGSDLPF